MGGASCFQSRIRISLISMLQRWPVMWYMGPRNIWIGVLPKYVDHLWNIRTPTSAAPQVHFQVRRCQVQDKHRRDGSDIYRICLNYCSCPWIVPASVIIRLKLNELYDLWSWYIPPLNSLRTMRMRDYPGGHGSMVNRSIARIAGAVKLNLWSLSVQYSWIRSIYHYANIIFVLAESVRSAVLTRAWKCCDNCTRVSACWHTEINSTHGKNSRAYGIQEQKHQQQPSRSSYY